MSNFTIGEWITAASEAPEVFEVPELVQARIKKLAEQFSEECKKHNLPFLVTYVSGSTDQVIKIGSLFGGSHVHRLPSEMLCAYLIINNGLTQGLNIVNDLHTLIGAKQ